MSVLTLAHFAGKCFGIKTWILKIIGLNVYRWASTGTIYALLYGEVASILSTVIKGPSYKKVSISNLLLGVLFLGGSSTTKYKLSVILYKLESWDSNGLYLLKKSGNCKCYSNLFFRFCPFALRAYLISWFDIIYHLLVNHGFLVVRIKYQRMSKLSLLRWIVWYYVSFANWTFMCSCRVSVHICLWVGKCSGLVSIGNLALVMLLATTQIKWYAAYY